MKVCLISVEIFAWGKYGGFGRATRTIGRELARRGVEVFAVVPRRPGQARVEKLDGITVLGFSPWWPRSAMQLLRQCDADVYHSCEPSFATHLALQAMPQRKHMVTCRDPRDFGDWKLELARPSLNRVQVLLNCLYEHNHLVRRAVRRADAVYTICRDLIPKARRIYRLDRDPVFLPTPVPIPDAVTKDERPTVCYVARLDRRKRPKLFLDLAAQFPDVRFIAVGRSRDRRWERHLRATYADVPNLEMCGFLDQFTSGAHAEVLRRSWILVNSATRESMPNSILEAVAHECALLSHVDPDGFATRFGYHARDDDFARGLQFLLEDRRWKERGLRGAAHVRDTFEMNRAMDLHLAAYEQLLCKGTFSEPSLRGQLGVG